MRYPAFLKDHDRIGFIAPSFGCASLEPYHTRFQTALSYFEGAGYVPVIGPNVYLEDGIGKSTTADKCGAESNDFFLNDQCDAVFSVGGGETMCEDLEFVDFKAIAAAKPKWFMGYSDNTNLTLTLATLCDTASVYGPNASSFGMRPLHPYLTDTLNVLSGKSLTAHNYPSWEMDSLTSEENPVAALNCTEPFHMSVHKDGRLIETSADAQDLTAHSSDFTSSPCETALSPCETAPTSRESSLRPCECITNSCEVTASGRMLGGCLDILCVLCGTRFDKVRAFTEKYDADGTIFFLESCDLNPLAIVRGLWQLKNAGWFRNTKAFLIGRPLHIRESMMGLDCRQAVLHVLGDLGVPIFFDLDIGHLPPQMPIICGAIGTVHAKGNSISIDYSLK